MKHLDVRRNLSAYLDGSVTSAERRAIEEHLESCRECRVALEELKRTTDLVRDLEEVEPPPWLAGKIMAKAREEAEMKKGIFRRLFSPFPVRISIEAAALVLVTITGVLVFRATRPELDISGTTAENETRQAAPSKAAPAAPPAAAPVEKEKAKERAGGKSKGTATSPKPPEQKREPVVKENRPPASPPEVGYAPAPPPASAAKSVPEFDGSAMDRSEEYPAAPAPRAARSMGAAEMAGRAKEEAKSAGIDRYKAKKAQKKNVEQGISFVLRPTGSSSVASDVERLVTRLGGTVVKSEHSGESRFIRVLIDAGKLDLLRAKLDSFGDVTVKGSSHASGGGAGVTAVSIEIKQELQGDGGE